MKAHTDNSFFIMSLARLGISFYIAETAKFFFDAGLSSLTEFDCVFEMSFFWVCFSSIKLLEVIGGGGVMDFIYP